MENFASFSGSSEGYVLGRKDGCLDVEGRDVGKCVLAGGVGRWVEELGTTELVGLGLNCVGRWVKCACVGFLDGKPAVGNIVGTIVGIIVGANEGKYDGQGDGISVGLSVGLPKGRGVGCSVGRRDGPLDGSPLG